MDCSINRLYVFNAYACDGYGGTFGSSDFCDSNTFHGMPWRNVAVVRNLGRQQYRMVYRPFWRGKSWNHFEWSKFCSESLGDDDLLC